MPNVVITGASSGIGWQRRKSLPPVALVAALARRQELLNALVRELKQRHPKGSFVGLHCEFSDWKEVSTVGGKADCPVGRGECPRQ